VANSKINKKSKAYRSGYNDGETRVTDELTIGDPDVRASREDVESWFAAGQEEADSGLINALNGQDLADELGITLRQCESRGPAFREACRDYNAGYRSGAIKTARRELAA
jgi:hypothetical protein